MNGLLDSAKICSMEERLAKLERRLAWHEGRALVLAVSTIVALVLVVLR